MKNYQFAILILMFIASVFIFFLPQKTTIDNRIKEKERYSAEVRQNYLDSKIETEMFLNNFSLNKGKE